MALAIAVMVALFVGLLVDAVYSAPKYEDFCDNYATRAYPDKFGINTTQCSDPYFVYQDEVRACENDKGYAEFDYDTKGCQVYSKCNFCNRDFNDANEMYNRNIFFIISPIAVVALLFGLLYGMEVIGSGFMFSGILLLVYSTGRYFSNMSKVMRVVVVGIELLLVLWITKKKMGKK